MFIDGVRLGEHGFESLGRSLLICHARHGAMETICETNWVRGAGFRKWAEYKEVWRML
jgi:hypothetical protein